MENSKYLVDGYLTGYLLIAMPYIQETRFEHSLVFICGHDANGAIGLILNKPLPSVYLPELLKQLSIPTSANTPNDPLYFGGPIDMSRGFVLHSLDYISDNTVVVNQAFGVTATIDVLRSISKGEGPKNYHISLGYSGWMAGELEREMQNNHWLTSKLQPDLVFNTSPDNMWRESMHRMGLQDSNIPYIGGHA